MPSARLGPLLLMTLPTAAAAQHASIGIAGPRPSEVLGVVARGPLPRALLTGGLLGGPVGALIGGRFPKAVEP